VNVWGVWCMNIVRYPSGITALLTQQSCCQWIAAHTYSSSNLWAADRSSLGINRYGWIRDAPRRKIQRDNTTWTTLCLHWCCVHNLLSVAVVSSKTNDGGVVYAVYAWFKYDTPLSGDKPVMRTCLYTPAVRHLVHNLIYKRYSVWRLSYFL